MPAHACGTFSHAWLKNVSRCRVAWHNFQNYVNSDPCKERNLCVKWTNDPEYLPCDLWFFEVKSTGSELAFICVLRLGVGNARAVSAYVTDGCLWKTSDFFWRLRTSLGIFGNYRVVFKNPSTPRIKISRLYFRKSRQVYTCKRKYPAFLLTLSISSSSSFSSVSPASSKACFSGIACSFFSLGLSSIKGRWFKKWNKKNSEIPSCKEKFTQHFGRQINEVWSCVFLKLVVYIQWNQVCNVNQFYSIELWQ